MSPLDVQIMIDNAMKKGLSTSMIQISRNIHPARFAMHCIAR
jgi:hypothetical protein